MRIRFGLKKKDLARIAGVSPSLIGRVEKGADLRVGTLRRLYAALGCRLVTLPAGALYDLDWMQARLDNDYLDWRREADKCRWRGGSELTENASSPPRDQ